MSCWLCSVMAETKISRCDVQKNSFMLDNNSYIFVVMLSLVKLSLHWSLIQRLQLHCLCCVCADVAGEHFGEELEPKSSFLHQQLLVSDRS